MHQNRIPPHTNYGNQECALFGDKLVTLACCSVTELYLSGLQNRTLPTKPDGLNEQKNQKSVKNTI
jgi:hypothetical protein